MAKRANVKKTEAAVDSEVTEPVAVSEDKPVAAETAIATADTEVKAEDVKAEDMKVENVKAPDADVNADAQDCAANDGGEKKADGGKKSFSGTLKDFFGKVWAAIKKAALFVWKYLKIAGIAVWKYLKTRWMGFFLLIPVVVLSLIEPAVYASGFFRTEYESMMTYMLPYFVLLGFALAFEKHTARYAPMAMFAITLVSLLEFIRTTYMHLSTAFFAGINGNVFVQAGFPFSFCVITLVINMVLCITAMFFKQYRVPKKSGAVEESAPATTEEGVSEVGNEQA